MAVSGGAVSPENRSNEDAAQLIAAHDANPPQGPWDECDGCHVEYVRSLLARIAAVEAQLARADAIMRDYVPPRIVEHFAALAASPTPTGPEPATWLTTDCGRCDNDWRAKLPWPERLSQRMIVCPDCGSKRCPRAAFHGNACDRGPATPEPTEETP